jgi:hypothetical protein
MAIEVLGDQIASLLAEQLHPRLRYRCLLLHCADIPTLSRVCESVIAAAGTLGNPCVLEHADQFDDIGAVSCRTVIARIEQVAATQPVILAGPLHYVDYWSEQVCTGFWRYLAAFMSGPGIIAVDAPRETVVEGAFRIVGRLPAADVRYLKSRLAATQDGLV